MRPEAVGGHPPSKAAGFDYRTVFVPRPGGELQVLYRYHTGLHVPAGVEVSAPVRQGKRGGGAPKGPPREPPAYSTAALMTALGDLFRAGRFPTLALPRSHWRVPAPELERRFVALCRAVLRRSKSGRRGCGTAAS